MRFTSRFTERTRWAGSLALLVITVSAPGVLLGKPQGLHETGEQNDPRVRIHHANPLDQLPTVHGRHAVIRHNHVELGSFKEFKALFSVGRDLYATPDLFQ